MRIVVGMCFWIIGAVLSAAIVIALTQWFPLTDSPLPLERKLDHVLNELFNRTHFLGYAALAGAGIALVSFIPSDIRVNAERLIFWGLFGAASGAISVSCAVFLYKGYWLYEQGVAVDSISLMALLTEEMRLDQYWPYGAIVGGAWALVLAVLSMVREKEIREAQQALANTSPGSPDTIIREHRAQRAQQYLADRSHGGTGPDRRT